MNSATDDLRALLDERGVEHRWDNGTATWYVDGVMYNAWGYDNERLTMSVCHLTPEQAVAATLGPGTCERVFYEPTGVYVCSKCGCGLSKKLDKYCYLNYCPNCGRKVIK